MGKAAKQAKLRKTVRIYYGTDAVPLYWTVPVSDAKRAVKINGTLADALKGTPGQTIGCHLSNCAMSQRNKEAFGHPVFYAAFTKRSAFIIDKWRNGAPAHAIRYHHWYGKLVDLNDTEANKQTILKNPQLAEREFVLQKPKKRLHRAGTTPHGKLTGERRAVVPLGALARAKKAKLITADLERITDSI